VVNSPAGVRVTVKSSAPPVFTVFRLNGPDRLVIDLSNTVVGTVKGHHDGQGPVTGIVASQFSDAKSNVARLLIGLDGASSYDVKADTNNLVVWVAKKGAEQLVTPTKVVVSEPEPKAAPAARATEPAAAHEAAKPVEPGQVSSYVDEKKVERAAERLVSIAYENQRVSVKTDGDIAKFEVIELNDPPRVAIDVFGVSGKSKAPRVSSDDALLKDIRVGAYPDKVRLVVEAKSALPKYRAKRTKNGLALTLSAGAAPSQTAQVQSNAQPSADEPVVMEIDGKSVPVVEQSMAKESQVSPVEVKAVSFEESVVGGRVEVKTSGKVKWTVERPDSKGAVLTLDNAKIAKLNEKSLDTSALSTPVKMVSVFAVPGDKQRVRVVLAASSAMKETVVETPAGLSWRFSQKDDAQPVVSSNQVAGFATEATSVAESSAPQRARYVGKKVSFEFKDIDIHNLLRIIAEVSKRNIVVADDVSGKVTIRLRNVPWDQALDLILRSKGLGQEELGNIVRVAPLATLQAEASARLERKKNLELAQDLTVQLMPVNYATASEMATRVKEVLSARGTVTVDTRTNTLIVRDLAQYMGKARSLVQSLDLQTPQVMIESRIVEANTTFGREVGIQWGGQGNLSPASGNPTGLIFPNTVSVAGGISGGATQGTAAAPQYAVSLPVGAGDGAGGALGFIFGSAGGALQLNLRLSAAETNGTVKTISAPKVTTLDNAQARISQGVSIPFSQVSAAGANTQFVEARLSLDVTPHITQDGSVLMQIRAENNQPDGANTGANGQPAIQRKEAATNVLVKDGDTTVIGGIYTRFGSVSENSVPILGKIPIIGFFFRRHIERDTKTELLIFITPRILNRQTVAQAQQP
jgi:type IV pilus assembly protein PilQ